MHIQTLSWARLPREIRDEKLIALGISNETLSKIRSLEPRTRIIEAARTASEFDPEPNSDFIEFIAGYNSRSGLHHHFRNMKELWETIGAIHPSKELNEVHVKSADLDLAEAIPKSFQDYAIHVETSKDLRRISIWQKVNGGMRLVILNRQISKILFWSGVLLYVTEGTKFSKSSGSVQIANAQPQVHRLFLDFLEGMGINRKGIRARIQLHNLRDRERAQRFWSGELGILPWQYYNPMLSKPRMPARRETFTLQLQYANSMLCILLKLWGENLDDLINHVQYP